MIDYDTIRHQSLKDAPLDDLIDGKFGPALLDAAMDLATAFSAMSTEDLITACHHDYRLSGEVRQAALNLSSAIWEQAQILAEQDQETARENAEYEHADWLLAGGY